MSDQLTLLSVHAHPDDEIFSTGGTLAKYAAEGIHTVLVTCTRGEEGEIVDPTMDVAAIQPRLAEVRTEELRCATAALGIETQVFLGYRDSGMAGTSSNTHPDSFNMASLEEATGRLVRLIRTHRPQVLTSYDPNGSYGHPDHIKAHQITMKAFDAAGDPRAFPEAGPAWQPQKLYYNGISRGQFERWRQMAEEAGIDSPWLSRLQRTDEPPRGLPADEITTFINIADYLPRKTAAFRCHRTQIRDDFFFFTVSEDFARRALYDECYIRVNSLVTASIPEDDLFAGLR